MKGNPFIYLLLAALLPTLAQAGSCNPHAQKRVVIGPKPTADTLYAHLHGLDMGAWEDGFSEETFTYIGETRTKAGKTYRIGYLNTVWGQACRATSRLYIFDGDDRPLGHYDGIITDPRKVTITGTVLKFKFDPSDGNTLDLGNGPPERARLDGDNEDWTPARPEASPPAPAASTAPI